MIMDEVVSESLYILSISHAFAIFPVLKISRSSYHYIIKDKASLRSLVFMVR
ncbi:hypothetical protein A1OE_1093 [Candidatus Endolissoclinum faulkneri L2]|uniref:Uncharacterized protein n=1 Tax=Candidatus Endolissoclinum faulkneri L2 TaxID=1193729 RepID=K7ZD77_9PROT|nr:hypothetical protein A1OE_1093 [Candidatus Endolissoclinum faulkneri L2]